MRYVQLHLITAYPPANLNRDDTQRPKTVNVGGTTRQRISSQSLKRAWRTSDVMRGVLGDTMGVRSARLVKHLASRMRGSLGDDAAMEAAKRIVGDAFAQLNKKEGRGEETGQMPFLDVGEVDAARRLADTIAEEGGREPTAEELAALRGTSGRSFDVAAFGRMLADHAENNVESAIDVAHAFSVNRSVLEDDFFTAVDDWKPKGVDSGAQHMGDVTFSANVFYKYLSINTDVLLANLGGDAETAAAGLDALVRAAATVGPPGMRASFGSHARASYVLAERGDSAPRSLAHAFTKAVRGEDRILSAIDALEENLVHMDRAYEGCADERCKLVDEYGTFSERRGDEPGENVVVPREGSIGDVARFCTEVVT